MHELVGHTRVHWRDGMRRMVEAMRPDLLNADARRQKPLRQPKRRTLADIDFMADEAESVACPNRYGSAEEVDGFRQRVAR